MNKQKRNRARVLRAKRAAIERSARPQWTLRDVTSILHTVDLLRHGFPFTQTVVRAVAALAETPDDR